MNPSVRKYLAKQLGKKGRLKPSELVVEAARKTNPLHGEFEWDDKKAGNQYRLIQARRLIRRYNVYVEEPGAKLVHVPSLTIEGGTREGEYKPVSVVVDTITEFERALNEALTQLRAAQAAVRLLEAAALKKSDDATAAKLAIALRSLSTVDEALRTIN